MLLGVFFYPLARMVGEGTLLGSGARIYPVAFGFISWSLLKLAAGHGKQVPWMVRLFAARFVLRYILL
jgi:hypothetical protein